VPDPCCSSCYDNAFDGRLAGRELREYRRKGPGRASRAIAEALTNLARDAGSSSAAARFAPAGLLKGLAAAGRGFHDAPAK